MYLYSTWWCWFGLNPPALVRQKETCGPLGESVTCLQIWAWNFGFSVDFGVIWGLFEWPWLPGSLQQNKKEKKMPHFGGKNGEGQLDCVGKGLGEQIPAALVPVFETSVWKEDEVFANFPGFLETEFGLCKLWRIFENFLGSLQAFGGTFKASWTSLQAFWGLWLPRDSASLGCCL